MHPRQPIYQHNNTVRFKPNRVVRALHDQFAVAPNWQQLITQFGQEDVEQVVQLLGWSVNDAHALGLCLDVQVTDPCWDRASAVEHPIQPLRLDDQGVVRFLENKLINHWRATGQLNLNELVVMGFSRKDHEQFAQLIGYSHSGAPSCVRTKVLDEAWARWECDHPEAKSRLSF